MSAWWSRWSIESRRAAKALDEGLACLRREIDEARARRSRADLEHLRARPRELGIRDDEADLELELIEASLELLDLVEGLERDGRLPVVETQHKVLGTDRCHFVASVSLDGADDGGKLFMTDRRLLLVGTDRVALSWSHIRQVSRQQRDLVLERRDGQRVYQVRCNTWSEALRGEHIARMLLGPGSNGRKAARPT